MKARDVRGFLDQLLEHSLPKMIDTPPQAVPLRSSRRSRNTCVDLVAVMARSPAACDARVARRPSEPGCRVQSGRELFAGGLSGHLIRTES
jgi:hypothetical protein